MVLTAIQTAIDRLCDRSRVFAGVHCRTDSLRVRISGHRCTAADASPVTGTRGREFRSRQPTIPRDDEVEHRPAHLRAAVPLTPQGGRAFRINRGNLIGNDLLSMAGARRWRSSCAPKLHLESGIRHLVAGFVAASLRR